MRYCGRVLGRTVVDARGTDRARLEYVLFQLPIVNGFLCLYLEALVGVFDLPNDAFDLAHVLFSLRKFELCFARADLVFGDARCLFEKIAPILRFGRKNLIDAPLLHYRIGRLSDSRIPKEFSYILQFCRFAVYEVFVFS